MTDDYVRFENGIRITLHPNDIDRVIRGLSMLKLREYNDAMSKDEWMNDESAWVEYHYCNALYDDIVYIQSLHCGE
jgi:hypothetical protein